MVASRNAGVSLDKFSLGEEILRWSLGRERVLNVVSLPYSSSAIFLQVILKHCRNKKRVLYITGEEEKSVDIISCIKKYSSFRDYSYLRNGSNSVTSALVVADFNRALEIKERFDLIIYDDLRSLPMHDSYEIADLTMKCANSDGKIAAFSIEDIFKRSREISIPVTEHRYPIIEPRIITTRVDINKDIPYVIYDFLNWSINSNRNVLILVPDMIKASSVYSYLLNYGKDLGKNIICFSQDENSEKSHANSLKARSNIIVVPIEQMGAVDLINADIMVYFADDKKFDYKKLVYFCGSAGRGEAFNKGEVIFLSNEESEDMEKAKSITRNFNKEAWELGLLNI